MLKILIAAITLIAPTCALAQEAQGTLTQGQIAIGSDLTYPPYNYFSANNVPAGFDVEMMTEIARIMGAKPKFLDTRFENLILGVKGGQFDVIASTLYVKPERAQQIDYIPYMKTGVSIAVASNSGLNISAPEELCGRIVGSIKGAAWLAELAKLNQTTCKSSPIDSREFPTSPEATQAVLSGGVNAQMEDSAVLASAAAQLGGRLTITTKRNFYPVVVGLGVKKGNTDLANAIRKAMTQMETSGFYPDLLRRYGVSKPTAEEFRSASGG